jgi:hypothetical protein
VVAALCCAIEGNAMQDRRTLGAVTPDSLFSPVVSAGGFVFVSD